MYVMFISCFSVFPDTALAVDVVQPSLLMRVQLGDSVTLTCFCSEETTFVAWFKQAVGQKPQLMVKALNLLSGEFYKEYKNIKRYSLQNAEGSFNLSISNTEPSDSAVYYCIAGNSKPIFIHPILPSLSPQCHDEDTLNYAALNLKNPKPRRQKKDGNNDTLYSDLRYRDYE
uniref:Ig-like domain-containing protein n=1 Tax=Paramormyrops kingsleyae TaxID=1676925 RepID=A0A3B3RZF1_9TELE